MKLWEQQAIFSKNVAKLILYISEQEYYCTIGECFRPIELAELYKKQGKGVLNSKHCDRLAIDLNLFSPAGEYLKDTESYSIFGKYWKSLNKYNKWGGDFERQDGNHFEMDV